MQYPENLYHGTTVEALSSILENGLKPQPNWDSGNLPVISLTDSVEQALREAFVVDATKIKLEEKSKPTEYFVAIKIKTENYTLEQWQVDEWWIKETILPAHIEIAMVKTYAIMKKEWEKSLHRFLQFL